MLQEIKRNTKNIKIFVVSLLPSLPTLMYIFIMSYVLRSVDTDNFVNIALNIYILIFLVIVILSSLFFTKVYKEVNDLVGIASLIILVIGSILNAIFVVALYDFIQNGVDSLF